MAYGLGWPDRLAAPRRAPSGSPMRRVPRRGWTLPHPFEPDRNPWNNGRSGDFPSHATESAVHSGRGTQALATRWLMNGAGHPPA